MLMQKVNHRTGKRENIMCRGWIAVVRHVVVRFLEVVFFILRPPPPLAPTAFAVWKASRIYILTWKHNTRLCMQCTHAFCCLLRYAHIHHRVAHGQTTWILCGRPRHSTLCEEAVLLSCREEHGSYNPAQ